MTTSKIYVVTDLGPGDGGKGGVVHAIATKQNVHTVLKRGGAQGSHGVHTSRGEKFAFSQWGCGTFEGIPTHITNQMVVSPEGLINEATALHYVHGIDNPFELLTVDQRALCATQYHGISSRIKELARRDNPRGTIGTGVGEAYRYSSSHPELAIHARDLSHADHREQLAAIRAQIQLDLDPIIDEGFLDSDIKEAEENLSLLADDGFLEFINEKLVEAGKKTTIVDADYLEEVILAKDGNAVVETSHGVLTDRVAGFHPHTSAIRTLPRFTHAMLRASGFDGEIVDIGVTRAYAIRHGAGPIPTANPEMSEKLLPGSHKDENRYQGKVRVGPLDMVLLRYAIMVSGGVQAFDGLAVTWFDQVAANGSWDICHRYFDDTDRNFFTGTGRIRNDLSLSDSLSVQSALGEKLKTRQPVVESIPLRPGLTNDDLYAICDQQMQYALGLSVRMVSFGPTEHDKILK